MVLSATNEISAYAFFPDIFFRFALIIVSTTLLLLICVVSEPLLSVSPSMVERIALSTLNSIFWCSIGAPLLSVNIAVAMIASFSFAIALFLSVLSVKIDDSKEGAVTIINIDAVLELFPLISAALALS